MKQSVRVATVQLYSRPGDKEYNMAQIRENVKRAANIGARFISFPELYYTGYDINKPQSLLVAETQNGVLYLELSVLAKKYGIYIICGYLEKYMDELYFSDMIVADDGTLLGNHRKTYLADDCEREKALSGSEYNTYETRYGKIGVLICYEMEFPEPARILAMKGANVIFVTSAFMSVHKMQRYLEGLALQNHVFVVANNHVGNSRGGNSRIVDPKGFSVAEASESYEELIYADIDFDYYSDVRNKKFDNLKKWTIQKCIDAYDENKNMLRSQYNKEKADSICMSREKMNRRNDYGR